MPEPLPPELERVAGLVGRATPPSEPPPDSLRERTIAAVEQERDRAGAQPARPERPKRPERPGTRWRWRLAPALAAAAAAAVIVAIVAGGDEPAGELELRAQLAGDGGGASAEVRETGIGRTIEFRSDSLRILPKGEFYELWFVGPGDRPGRPNRISAGTFHPDPEGRSNVSFTAAVDPAKYPRLSVTAEPGDGDPAPSGSEVLSSRR